MALVEKPPWWIDAVKTLGLPTVFLGVLTYMIWVAGGWTGNTIVLPLFRKQMEFIEKASSMTEEMNRTTSLINQTLDAHGQHAVENLKTCQRIEATVRDTDTNIKVMQKSHDQTLSVLRSIDENTKPLRSTEIEHK